MNRRLMLLAVLIVACLAFARTPVAKAHVLLTDETGSQGLVLHIVPDDDPVAGQPSQLFFDIRNITTRELQNFTLSVQDTANATQSVPLRQNNNTLQATYTFPTQGVYHLVLRSQQSHAIRFVYDLRVGRGLLGIAADEQSTPGWATTGVVLSLTGLLALVIVAWNNRVRIAEHSRTHR